MEMRLNFVSRTKENLKSGKSSCERQSLSITAAVARRKGFRFVHAHRRSKLLLGELDVAF